MTLDLSRLRLDRLFRDPSVLHSRSRLRDAGFEIFDRSSEHKAMVATHPDARGVVFKAYDDQTAASDQVANFRRRVEGAERVTVFVRSRGLRRLVVPAKAVVAIPGDRHVLVAERLPVLSGDAAKRAYADVDEEILRDLCVVFHAFRGMDSTVKNVPLTRDGRSAAFIDTEHWDRHLGTGTANKPYLRHLSRYLSDDHVRIARKVFDRLNRGR